MDGQTDVTPLANPARERYQAEGPSPEINHFHLMVRSGPNTEGIKQANEEGKIQAREHWQVGLKQPAGRGLNAQVNKRNTSDHQTQQHDNKYKATLSSLQVYPI